MDVSEGYEITATYRQTQPPKKVKHATYQLNFAAINQVPKCDWGTVSAT